jgi:hypothetical protein
MTRRRLRAEQTETGKVGFVGVAPRRIAETHMGAEAAR